MIDVGFLARTEEEVRLYRILDITMKRSLFDRMFNALGIDLGELEAALGSTFDEEGAADSDPNNDSTTSR